MEQVNVNRARRDATSLDSLNRTLEDLESQLRGAMEPKKEVFPENEDIADRFAALASLPLVRRTAITPPVWWGRGESPAHLADEHRLTTVGRGGFVEARGLLACTSHIVPYSMFPSTAMCVSWQGWRSSSLLLVLWV